MHGYRYSVVALVFAVILGCGSGGDSEPASVVGDALTITSSGDGPLRQLNVGGDLQRRYQVDAIVTNQVNIGERSSQQSTRADFDIVATMQSAANVTRLELLPVLNSFQPASEQPDTDELTLTSQQFSTRGVLQDAGGYDSSGLFNASTFGVFAIPPLVLATPDREVGIDASWRFTNRLDDFAVESTVTVNALDDDRVTVLISASLLDPHDVVDAYQSSTTASYSLPSLLLESADISSTLSFTGSANVNQIDEPVSGTMTAERTIRSRVQ
jgi:hypothetical protein